MDWKEFYKTHSTYWNPVDHAIHGDFAVIRYEFETNEVHENIRIPEKMNPTNPLTKTDSPESRHLELIMRNGTIPVDFHQALFNRSDKSAG